MTVARIIVMILSIMVLTLMAVGWRVQDSAPSSGVCLIQGTRCVPVNTEEK